MQRNEAQNRKRGECWICWLLASLIMLGGGGLQAAPSPSPAAIPNEEILRAQLFLDASAFKPGAVDAKWGEFMRKALQRYEKAEGKSGAEYEEKAPAKIDLPFEEGKALLISYTFSPNDQKFIGPVPESHAAQAKAESLPYEYFLELLGE